MLKSEKNIRSKVIKLLLILELTFTDENFSCIKSLITVVVLFYLFYAYLAPAFQYASNNFVLTHQSNKILYTTNHEKYKTIFVNQLNIINNVGQQALCLYPFFTKTTKQKK
jgi:cephalosporin-C deacetylase-like acetyl esterase